MKKMLKKSKGFTLVELLIVIIIIGILAGMMMLSTGSATDKAEATKIVANMRTIKSGCLMFYADKGYWPSADATGMTGVSDFLDASIDSTEYTLASGTNASLDVKATPKALKQTGVQSKLQKMADDAGLFSDAPCSTKYSAGGTTEAYMIVKKK